MKQRLITITMILVYIAGFLFFSYPDLNSFKSSREVRKKIEEFHETVAAWNEAQESSAGTSQSTGGTTQTAAAILLEKMQGYNAELYENGQKYLTDPWAYEVSSFDLQEYGLVNDVAAIISIPSIDVELPVYLGASTPNMAQGAAHLSQTSLPIGGINTNCVIAAHRGYKGIPMFRDIEGIRIGDDVVLTNFWETITYHVTDIRIIEPDDSASILIQEGKDMLTLLTCHPYRSNTYRYVVFCERTQEAGEGMVSTEAASGEVVTDRAEDSSAVETQSSVAQQIVITESAENVREAAMEQDAGVLNNEEFLRKIGYVLYLLVGAAIVISLFPAKKKRK